MSLDALQHSSYIDGIAVIRKLCGNRLESLPESFSAICVGYEIDFSEVTTTQSR